MYGVVVFGLDFDVVYFWVEVVVFVFGIWFFCIGVDFV